MALRHIVKQSQKSHRAKTWRKTRATLGLALSFGAISYLPKSTGVFKDAP
jgi:hypothetical protein